MRKILLLTTLSALCSVIHAQNGALFIYEQFTNAKIYFKNRAVTVAPMNYDAVNDKMYFKQNEDLMELTNAYSIDSIVWPGKRSFIPYENKFMEIVNIENGKVYIHWRINNVNIGSKGALGMVTQAKVESINIRSMGVFSAESNRINTADIYKQKNANEYYIPIEGKLKKVNSLKHIYKLYPKHKEEIKEYAKRENIKMNEPLSVLQLLNFCLKLE